MWILVFARYLNVHLFKTWKIDQTWIYSHFTSSMLKVRVHRYFFRPKGPWFFWFDYGSSWHSLGVTVYQKIKYGEYYLWKIHAFMEFVARKNSLLLKISINNWHLLSGNHEESHLESPFFKNPLITPIEISCEMLAFGNAREEDLGSGHSNDYACFLVFLLWNDEMSYCWNEDCEEFDD